MLQLWLRRASSYWPTDLSIQRKIKPPLPFLIEQEVTQERITKELDMKPASLFVRRYIRYRYVSQQETFHISPLSARVIDKGIIPGAGLLWRIICDNFVTHLPFNRQRQRYEQLGMKIPASTLTDGLRQLVLYWSRCNKLLPDKYYPVRTSRWTRPRFPFSISRRRAKPTGATTGSTTHRKRNSCFSTINPDGAGKVPQNCSKTIKAICRRMATRYTNSLKSGRV